MRLSRWLREQFGTKKGKEEKRHAREESRKGWNPNAASDTKMKTESKTPQKLIERHQGYHLARGMKGHT